MGQMNRSKKTKAEANRSARDVTESHRRFAWNPFSWKLIKPTCFSPVWRKWRKSDKRSSSSSPKEEEASPELPPEMIREILIRLPVKSVGRSRCVSKLFLSLSSDPGFAKSQLDLTVHQKLIVSSHETYLLHLYSIGGGGGSQVTLDLIAANLNYPHGEDGPFGGSWVKIFGSSNGLLACFSLVDEVVFLYNPTTRESKRLPQRTETAVASIYEEGFQSYGFGFDHLTNDYKVVKLVADKKKILLYACVYSLKSNSWRRICDLNYNGSRLGVNLNGVIHWVVFTRGGNHKQKRVILALDVLTQEFREVPYPDEEEAEEHPNSMVGNLNGRLCVFNRSSDLRDDVWVMNEYGVASSWTRIRISFLYKSMKLLCSSKNSEEVILEIDGAMVLYNFETHAWRKLEIQGVDRGEGFDVNTYVESLISPNWYGLDRNHLSYKL